MRCARAGYDVTGARRDVWDKSVGLLLFIHLMMRGSLPDVTCVRVRAVAAKSKCRN